MNSFTNSITRQEEEPRPVPENFIATDFRSEEGLQTIGLELGERPKRLKVIHTFEIHSNKWVSNINT